MIVTTYGTWLAGDARGFRTRHHREHVEGDYKYPPPREQYARRRKMSRDALKQEPVVLDSPDWRRIVGGVLVEKYQRLGAFVLCAALSKTHGHLLVKMPRPSCRIWRGHAKRHAWFEARDRGWMGHLWAIGGREVPIEDRPHQLNTYRYILRHHREGAWVWWWKRPAAHEIMNCQTPAVATLELGG